jgi:selenide,water dikinase
MSRSLVLVGAGHTHCLALLQMKLDGASVTLISDTEHAYYSGMLPAMIAGQFREEELRIDVAALCRSRGAQLVLGRAQRVDHRARVVHVLSGDASVRTIAFDVLSINVGSITRGADLEGVAAFALCTRPIALLPSRLAAREAAFTRCPTVVVVGGGAAGCELAMALAARHRALFGSADVSLVSGRIDELGRAGARLSDVLRAALRERGIKLVAGRAVRVDADQTVRTVSGDGVESTLAAELVVWAAGAAPPPLVTQSDLPLAADGFFDVRRSLQSTGCDYVFAAGDCCCVRDSPQIERAGVFAVREAPVLAHNLAATLYNLDHPNAPRPLTDYSAQTSFLRLIVTGDGGAIACKWGWLATPSTQAANWLKTKLDTDFMRLFS